MRKLVRAAVNLGVLVVGGLLGALSVALWGSLQPGSIDGVSTMDPTFGTVTPSVVSLLVWAVGIGVGVMIAYTLLRYVRRI